MRNQYKCIANDIKTNQYVKQDEETIKKQKTTYIDKQGTKHIVDQVGVQENKHGFGFGQAPLDAKPSTNLQTSMKKEKGRDMKGQEQPSQQEEEKSEFEERQTQQKNLLVDKNDIFKDWKGQEGKELNQTILGSIDKLRQQKKEIKQFAKQLMNFKVQIEVLKQNIERKQKGKTQEELDRGIIDEEEFQFIRDQKECKKQYKKMGDELRRKKIYIKELDQEIRRCKYLLLTRFDDWYQVRYGKNLQDQNIRQLKQESSQSMTGRSQISEDIDSDAVAYVQARGKTKALQLARRNERLGKYI